MQDAVVNGVHAIEAQPQAHHVEVAFGEAFDACTVANVAQNFVVEGVLQGERGVVEQAELLGRESVEVRTIATHKVREYRARHQRRLVRQAVDEYRHVGPGIEAQAVHARVNLDVYGESLYALLFSGAYQRLQQFETVHLGLEFVFKEGVKGRHLRVHHDDARRDACAAQFGALVGHGHGQVVHALVLQRTGNLYAACAVGRSLHHAGDAGARFHEGAVVVQVLRECFQVHVEGGFVHPQREGRRHLLKTKAARALDEHHVALQRVEHTAGQQGLAGGEKGFGQVEEGLHLRQCRTYAYEHLHAAALHHAGHGGIEFGGRHTRLQ